MGRETHSGGEMRNFNFLNELEVINYSALYRWMKINKNLKKIEITDKLDFSTLPCPGIRKFH